MLVAPRRAPTLVPAALQAEVSGTAGQAGWAGHLLTLGAEVAFVTWSIGHRTAIFLAVLAGGTGEAVRQVGVALAVWSKQSCTSEHSSAPVSRCKHYIYTCMSTQICPDHANHMPTLCPKLCQHDANNMPTLCLNCVSTMSKIYLQYANTMPTLPRMCQNYTNTMPVICQHYIHAEFSNIPAKFYQIWIK